MEYVDPIRDRSDIKQMLALLRRQEKYRDHLLLTVGFNTALRISDILSLKVKHVRKEGGYRDHIRLREQKNNNNGRHYINRAIERALDLYFEHNKDKSQDDYLFATYAGQMSRERASQIIKETTGKLALEGNYSTHSMRKSWAYHAIDQGAKLTRVQHKLGHNSAKQTKEYCGITDDDVDEIVKDLNLGL